MSETTIYRLRLPITIPVYSDNLEEIKASKQIYIEYFKKMNSRATAVIEKGVVNEWKEENQNS